MTLPFPTCVKCKQHITPSDGVIVAQINERGEWQHKEECPFDALFNCPFHEKFDDPCAFCTPFAVVA